MDMSPQYHSCFLGMVTLSRLIITISQEIIHQKQIYFMKNIILSAFFLFGLIGCIYAQQQTTATTADGRKILLYDDGTWRLLKPTTSSSNIETEYQRPTKSNQFVKAAVGAFGVWIDPQKWKQDSPSDEAQKISFNHIKGDAYAMIIAERIPVPTETLKKIALEIAKKSSTNCNVLSEEKRLVNGKEVLCVKIQATIQNIPFTFYNYYYGGPEGTIQVDTFTSTNLFDEYKSDFEDFLNGLKIGN